MRGQKCPASEASLKNPSILNDVLGPVMRGPSSSHTAGSYHIGRTVRDLLGERPARAAFRFDPGGSYARTFRQQGVDLALAAGLMGCPVTGPEFLTALAKARKSGLRIVFEVAKIAGASHPNTVEIRLESGSGKKLSATAESTGGGSFLIRALDGWPVRLDGKSHMVLLWGDEASEAPLRRIAGRRLPLLEKPAWLKRGAGFLLSLRLSGAPDAGLLRKLAAAGGVRKIRTAAPVYHVQKGRALFASAAEMLRLAGKNGWTLGRTALAYEAALLCVPEKTVRQELLRRYGIMRESVNAGLAKRGVAMQLLRPTAHKVWKAEKS
ncbi:MAG: L-serine ammonia-lyase, iron-sulfur-dependent, subunit alpha, partial [Candidatus Aminicenantales bacterium]